jgi:hypothetical protein
MAKHGGHPKPTPAVYAAIAIAACIGVLILGIVALGIRETGPFTTQWPKLNPVQPAPADCRPADPDCPPEAP